jgi:hypothetical protein
MSKTVSKVSKKVCQKVRKKDDVKKVCQKVRKKDDLKKVCKKVCQKSK